MLAEFSKINCKREELDTLIQRFRKQKAPTTGTRAADQSTEEKVTTVDELVSLLSQEGQKQTLCPTRQIYREAGLTQCSIVQIIHRDLGLKCFFIYQHACCLVLLGFLTFILHKVV